MFTLKTAGTNELFWQSGIGVNNNRVGILKLSDIWSGNVIDSEARDFSKKWGRAVLSRIVVYAYDFDVSSYDIQHDKNSDISNIEKIKKLNVPFRRIRVGNKSVEHGLKIDLDYKDKLHEDVDSNITCWFLRLYKVINQNLKSSDVLYNDARLYTKKLKKCSKLKFVWYPRSHCYKGELATALANGVVTWENLVQWSGNGIGVNSSVLMCHNKLWVDFASKQDYVHEIVMAHAYRAYFVFSFADPS